MTECDRTTISGYRNTKGGVALSEVPHNLKMSPFLMCRLTTTSSSPPKKEEALTCRNCVQWFLHARDWNFQETLFEQWCARISWRDFFDYIFDLHANITNNECKWMNRNSIELENFFAMSILLLFLRELFCWRLVSHVDGWSLMLMVGLPCWWLVSHVEDSSQMFANGISANEVNEVRTTWYLYDTPTAVCNPPPRA